VLEGMLVNAPSANARSTMVAASSDIYLRHFALAVKTNDVVKAFRIVERARGRAVADLLWGRPTDKRVVANDTASERKISALQIQLIRAQSRAQREKVLSDLFEAEEWRSAAVSESVRRYTVRESVSIRALQRILSPSELVLQYVLSDPDS